MKKLIPLLIILILCSCFVLSEKSVSCFDLDEGYALYGDTSYIDGELPYHVKQYRAPAGLQCTINWLHHKIGNVEQQTTVVVKHDECVEGFYNNDLIRLGSIKEYCASESKCEELRVSNEDIIGFDTETKGPTYDAVTAEFWYIIHPCSKGCVNVYNGPDYCISGDDFDEAMDLAQSESQPIFGGICVETDKIYENGFQTDIPGITMTNVKEVADECVDEQLIKEYCCEGDCGEINAADGEVPFYPLLNFKYNYDNPCIACVGNLENARDFCLDDILTPDLLGLNTVALEQGIQGSSISCSDGLDNDNDGFIDYPNDLGCKDSEDDDETNAACFNRIDDDFDGTADYAGGCDEDGDGKIDNQKTNCQCVGLTKCLGDSFLVGRFFTAFAILSDRLVTDTNKETYKDVDDYIGGEEEEQEEVFQVAPTGLPTYYEPDQICVQNGADWDSESVTKVKPPVFSYECNDGIDNDNDNKIDLGGCDFNNDKKLENKVVTDNGLVLPEKGVTAISCNYNGGYYYARDDGCEHQNDQSEASVLSPTEVAKGEITEPSLFERVFLRR